MRVTIFFFFSRLKAPMNLSSIRELLLKKMWLRATCLGWWPTRCSLVTPWLYSWVLYLSWEVAKEDMIQPASLSPWLVTNQYRNSDNVQLLAGNGHIMNTSLIIIVTFEVGSVHFNQTIFGHWWQFVYPIKGSCFIGRFWVYFEVDSHRWSWVTLDFACNDCQQNER